MHNSADLGSTGVILNQKGEKDENALVDEDYLIDKIIFHSILIFALENLVKKELLHSSQSNIKGTKDDIRCEPPYFAIKSAISFNSTLIIIVDQSHKEEMSNKEDDFAMYQVKPRYKGKHHTMASFFVKEPC